MHIPSSTYRIQLHKDFTFKDVEDILDYLQQLGVSTIYAAPILSSTPGSMHGYDVIDPHTIDPEIGTLEEFKTLSKKLRKKGMFWLQDIVPNHMAFNTKNYRLMDVLERGDLSPYYNYFDIDWQHPSPALNGKLEVPFLGTNLEDCIGKNEIQVVFEETGFFISYYDTQYPCSVQALEQLLPLIKNEKLVKQIEELMIMVGIGHEEWCEYKIQWVKKVYRNNTLRRTLQQAIALLNRDKLRLLQFIEFQNYILSFWQHADREINYRRFFTVNELICLRMEDEFVFDDYHKFLYRLYQEELIHGLRIDHIDGLNSPLNYIIRLRKLFGESVYIIAEKILEAREEMPADWPLEGTSGYEFLSHINQLITDRVGAKTLIGFYKGLVHDLPSYKALVYENKKLILENYMGGEWENLTQYFMRLKLQSGFEKNRVKHALGLMMLSLPVYRIYPEDLPLKGVEQQIMMETFDKAIQRAPSFKDELTYFSTLFTAPLSSDISKNDVLVFLKRLMQFTGPLTAKGVEDTTFYVYNPLISHDEVGDSPAQLGITIQEFHAKMRARQSFAALSLNATATHDTKRGEDSRIRLNVLSEIPALWIEHVNEWFVLNEAFRRRINDKTIPTSNDEYFIYQTLVGSFPEDFTVKTEWLTRLKEYLRKAMREAKINSNWSVPDEAYENGCLGFVEDILHEGNPFLQSFIPFVSRVVDYASVYALVQVVLKATAPGIPDVYQGCELFDLSFVDPDNRRPINYIQRKKLLDQIVRVENRGVDKLRHFLTSNRNQGAEKLFFTWKLLNYRKKNDLLFTKGDYIPLEISDNGKQAIAYARQFNGHYIVIVLPLSIACVKLQADFGKPRVIFPDGFPAKWKNIFTGKAYHRDAIQLENLFSDFPVAVFEKV
jgi:(1->4)-alpha-D-glucan 1-alpha-D-glucosylmutase